MTPLAVRPSLAVIGGGPAGLRAAEVAAEARVTVTVFDAKSSVGRKFLVAGRGGLNLTKAEPIEQFLRAYAGPDFPRETWNGLIRNFSPEALRDWAARLGVETFVAGTGRVYPRQMKAAPLLRRWVQHSRAVGVQFSLRHRWRALRPGKMFELDFETPEGPRLVTVDAVILAMGGGSWPETGSDGAWVADLRSCGVEVADLQPANCGWEADWPAGMREAAEGRPVKNIVARAGTETAAGELLITRYGLEGGAIYQLGAALRAMEQPRLTVDLKPSVEATSLVRRLGPLRRNFLTEARGRWKLSDAQASLLTHFAPREAVESASGLATACKELVIPLRGPRPIAEAISSAGGVRWKGLDSRLMLRALPGVFCAGEMVDWEAPTGGYLMQGCFASGTRAGAAAAEWVLRAPR